MIPISKLTVGEQEHKRWTL